MSYQSREIGRSHGACRVLLDAPRHKHKLATAAIAAIAIRGHTRIRSTTRRSCLPAGGCLYQMVSRNGPGCCRVRPPVVTFVEKARSWVQYVKMIVWPGPIGTEEETPSGGKDGTFSQTLRAINI